MTRSADRTRADRSAQRRFGSAVHSGLGVAVFTLAFIATIAAIDRGLTALDLQRQPPTNLDLVGLLDDWRAAVADVAREPGRQPVALIGDSLIMPSSRQETNDSTTVANALDRHLRTRRPELRIVPLRWGGLGPTEVYYLADEIAGSGVREAIITLNLAALSPDWAIRLNRSELSGWVSTRRVPATLVLPLHRVGLSADRFLWYHALRALGWEDAWHRLVQFQVRAKSAPQRIADAIGKQTGADAERRHTLQRIKAAVDRDTMPGGERLNRNGVLAKYETVLAGIAADLAPLQFLVSALDVLRDAGIRTTVVAMPVNLEHWRKVGALADEAGLARTLSTVRRRVSAAGASFVDLHDLLPDDAFRDKSDHFTDAGPDNGTQRVAAAMGAALGDLDDR